MVKDLIQARLEAGGQVLFEVSNVRLEGLDGDRPAVRFRADGRTGSWPATWSRAATGSTGSAATPPGRRPPGVRARLPFALAGRAGRGRLQQGDRLRLLRPRLRPPQHALAGKLTPHSYLQVHDPDEPIRRWPDERIWEELQARLATDDGWTLDEGPILDKGVTGMRSFVVEPMRFGRLFLAGDAAHIVPPTGAKGMNLAVADVRVLAEALAAWYRSGSSELLDAWSTTCLRRVWRAQDFSTWMTGLHRAPGGGLFQLRIQRARLDYLAASGAAARSLAENFVGLERV